MKSVVAINNLPRLIVSFVDVESAAEADKPDMYERYPGTRGITHGDINEINPAIAETNIASNRFPSKT